MDTYKKVLIVDDDENICEMVRISLEAEGYTVDTALDGSRGLEKATTGNYQLLLLDIMLPEVDGLEVCTRVRNSPNRGVPIIMLTAKVEEVDRVLGLELGADDYITKPFSPRELAARVKALLRRYETYNPPHSAFQEGSLEVNLDSHTARVGEHHLNLTPKELELLVLFMRYKGRAFSRKELLEKIWNYHSPVESTRTVDEHVKRLRNKIGEHDRKHSYIHTVWGFGYKFEGKEA